MSLEGQLLDRKSLRAVTGKSADWPGLAKDCVAFANGVGGRLLIGIEDGEEAPPPTQRISADLADMLRRRIGELTVNVAVRPAVCQAGNGGEYVELTIARSVQTTLSGLVTEGKVSTQGERRRTRYFFTGDSYAQTGLESGKERL